MADKYVKLDDIIETLEHEWGYEGMREDLYNLPTADVVPVVRCRECENFKFINIGGLVGVCNLGDDQRSVGLDDFCSYGERKDNNDT